MVNKQDYLNAINQNIDMVRGDTLAFNFKLQGLTQAECEALEVTFAITDNYAEGAQATIDTESGITLESYTDCVALFSVCLAPEITAEMDVARYYYDLQIKDTANTITLMRGTLTLLPEVAE